MSLNTLIRWCTQRRLIPTIDCQSPVGRAWGAAVYFAQARTTGTVWWARKVIVWFYPTVTLIILPIFPLIATILLCVLLLGRAGHGRGQRLRLGGRINIISISCGFAIDWYRCVRFECKAYKIDDCRVGGRALQPRQEQQQRDVRQSGVMPEFSLSTRIKSHLFINRIS